MELQKVLVTDPIFNSNAVVFQQTMFSNDNSFFKEKFFECSELIKSHNFKHIYVDVTDFKIIFYHHEREIPFILKFLKIDTLFPRNISVLRSPITISQWRRVTEVFELSFQGHVEFIANKKKLLKQAKSYIKEQSTKVVPYKKSTQGTEDLSAIPPINLVIKFLKEHDGVAIGERAHSCISSKQLLIENLQLLKDNGVKTLYIEHLFYDSMLNELNLSDGIISQHIEMYLQKLDWGHHVEHDKYNFTNLIKKALEVGFRVVPIDTTISYSCGTSTKQGVDNISKRIIAMNYVATQIVEADREVKSKIAGKYITFIGGSHLVRCKTFPGVAELLGIPSVLLTDTETSEMKICANERVLGLDNPVSLYIEHPKIIG